MVLAKIFSMPNLRKARNSRFYWYIQQVNAKEYCNIVLKIIPSGYMPSVGDIVNVRDGTGKKPQITIIQHDRPVSPDIIFYLSYHEFITPQQNQDIIPFVVLEPNVDVLQSWYGYTQGYWYTQHHFFVLSKSTTLIFKDIRGKIRKEVIQ